MTASLFSLIFSNVSVTDQSPLILMFSGLLDDLDPRVLFGRRRFASM